MEKIIPSIIFMGLGMLGIIFVVKFNIDDILGYLLAVVGVIFIGIEVFKSNTPLEIIFELISNFL